MPLLLSWVVATSLPIFTAIRAEPADNAAGVWFSRIAMTHDDNHTKWNALAVALWPQGLKPNDRCLQMTDTPVTSAKEAIARARRHEATGLAGGGGGSRQCPSPRSASPCLRPSCLQLVRAETFAQLGYTEKQALKHVDVQVTFPSIQHTFLRYSSIQHHRESTGSLLTRPIEKRL